MHPFLNVTFEQFSEQLLKSSLDAALQPFVSHDCEICSASKTNSLKQKLQLLLISNEFHQQVKGK